MMNAYYDDLTATVSRLVTAGDGEALETLLHRHWDDPAARSLICAGIDQHYAGMRLLADMVIDQARPTSD